MNVFITGASSGIGKALVREYWQEGYQVTLAARRQERLQSLAAELNQKRPDSAFAVYMDVNKEVSAYEAVRQSVEKFGSIDIAVANAGFGVVGAVDSLSLSDFERQFETNVYGVLRTFYACRDQLLKHEGRFAIIGSVNSYISLPKAAPYCMSKHAVKALSEALYHELHEDGASCTLICPGFVESEIRHVDNQGKWSAEAEPPPRYFTMSAEKAAKKIRKAIEARRRELVFTGHGFWAVLFVRHLPWLFHGLIRVFGIRGRRSAGKE